MGREEGDEDAIAEETLEILLQDDAVCDEIIAALKPDVSSLCAAGHSPVCKMQVLGRLHRGVHAQRAGPRCDPSLPLALLLSRFFVRAHSHAASCWQEAHS